MLTGNFPFFPNTSNDGNAKLKLAPCALRVSAAGCFRRARIARLNALRNPATRDRELRSAAYWVSSAMYWRSQATLDSFFPVAAE